MCVRSASEETVSGWWRSSSAVVRAERGRQEPWMCAASCRGCEARSGTDVYAPRACRWRSSAGGVVRWVPGSQTAAVRAAGTAPAAGCPGGGSAAGHRRPKGWSHPAFAFWAVETPCPQQPVIVLECIARCCANRVIVSCLDDVDDTPTSLAPTTPIALIKCGVCSDVGVACPLFERLSLKANAWLALFVSLCTDDTDGLAASGMR